MTPRIAVDTKNLALYTGGIAGFFRPLLLAWVAARPQIQFVLVGPDCDLGGLKALPNCAHHIVTWPANLPRPLRHPWYDNLLFPRAVREIKPDFVFSPYHDVRLPVGIPSTMMIHDTCIDDLPTVYPRQIRAYYLAMLRLNIRRARYVLTVSEASRACLLARYNLNQDSVRIVPNTLEPDFLVASDEAPRVAEIRARHPSGLRLFYPSGAEFRKNVKRLLDALHVLISRGVEAHLLATGVRDAGWERALTSAPSAVLSRVHFLGKLSLAELRSYYLAADTVVYPSLCEGFGRVCLEAMELGVPIACSNLPALREVAGDYPIYFDPLNIEEISDKILASAALGRREARHERRFHRKAVTELFVKTMDKILSTELGYA